MDCLICLRDSMARLLLATKLYTLILDQRVVSDTHLLRGLKCMPYSSLSSVFSLRSRMLVYSMLLREMMDWKVLKLPPERVEALCFLCIWLISESSLLSVDSLRFWRLVGLLLSFLFLDFILRAGWLSFRTFQFFPCGNSFTLFLKVRWEMLSLKELLSPWLMRKSRCCMDCTLNSPTNLSRLVLLSVMVIYWRGRQYLRMVWSSFTTTPQRVGLKVVTMQCLARKIANSMNCLWISLTVRSGSSLKASSSAAGTYWQKRSMYPPSQWALRRFTAFLCEMLLSLSTFSAIP